MSKLGEFFSKPFKSEKSVTSRVREGIGKHKYMLGLGLFGVTLAGGGLVLSNTALQQKLGLTDKPTPQQLQQQQTQQQQPPPPPPMPNF